MAPEVNVANFRARIAELETRQAERVELVHDMLRAMEEDVMTREYLNIPGEGRIPIATEEEVMMWDRRQEHETTGEMLVRLTAERDANEEALRSLMAVIHGDGGHRQVTFPTLAEAAEDCQEFVVERRVELDNLKVEVCTVMQERNRLRTDLAGTRVGRDALKSENEKWKREWIRTEGLWNIRIGELKAENERIRLDYASEMEHQRTQYLHAVTKLRARIAELDSIIIQHDAEAQSDTMRDSEVRRLKAERDHFKNEVNLQLLEIGGLCIEKDALTAELNGTKVSLTQEILIHAKVLEQLAALTAERDALKANQLTDWHKWAIEHMQALRRVIGNLFTTLEQKGAEELHYCVSDDDLEKADVLILAVIESRERRLADLESRQAERVELVVGAYREGNRNADCKMPHMAWTLSNTASELDAILAEGKEDNVEEALARGRERGAAFDLLREIAKWMADSPSAWDAAWREKLEKLLGEETPDAQK